MPHPITETEAAAQEARKCAECASALTARRKLFCSPKCSQTWHNRQLKRGQIVVPFVMAWVATSGKTDVGKYAMTYLTQLARSWGREDRKAGRLPMTNYVEMVKATGKLACDVVAS